MSSGGNAVGEGASAGLKVGLSMEDPVSKFSSYEEYLDTFVTPLDLFYLEDPGEWYGRSWGFHNRNTTTTSTQPQ